VYSFSFSFMFFSSSSFVVMYLYSFCVSSMNACVDFSASILIVSIFFMNSSVFILL